MMREPDVTALETELRSSVVVRAIDVVARSWTRALAHSAVVAHLEDVRARYRQSSPVNRLRAIACGVLTAVLGHLALIRLLSPQVAPGIPQGFWGLVAATAALLALCANRVTIGWESSLVRRLWSAIAPPPRVDA